MSTAPIQFIVVLPQHRHALAAGRDHLASMLGIGLPEGWPEFPEAFDPRYQAPDINWPAYLFVSANLQSVVGNGGFTGAPVNGEVEIGYEIAPEFRNQGYATAAARALLAEAFEHPNVDAVIAHTLAEHNASNAVLVKIGMGFVGAFPDGEVGEVWRWRVLRAG